MSLILDGTNGLSDVDGSAATPAIRGTDANTGIFFPAADTIAFSEGGTEVARINSSGNVGIGTASPLTPLHAVGAIQSQRSGVSQYARMINSAGTATFISDNQASGAYTGFDFQGLSTASATPVTYASIDGSGNLLVGTTSASGGERLSVLRGTNEVVCRFRQSLTSGYASEVLQVLSAQGSSTGYSLLACYYGDGAAYAFRVRGDGTLFAQYTTVQSASDLRFKENIVNSTDGLNIVESLRPVRFDLKEGNGVTGKENQLGFIAQEVQAVFPEAVDVWGESDDPENPYLSLGTSALIPVLVKAIQELKATVDAQAARIAALENPPVESVTNE